MQKHEFSQLFSKALEDAAAYAEERLGRAVARDFEIELHGAGHSGICLSPDEALNLLFISEDRFYRVIDVAVIEIRPTKTRIFVRPSDHTPSAFEETWNQPPGAGPFKQIYAEHFRISDAS